MWLMFLFALRASWVLLSKVWKDNRSGNVCICALGRWYRRLFVGFRGIWFLGLIWVFLFIAFLL